MTISPDELKLLVADYRFITLDNPEEGTAVVCELDLHTGIRIEKQSQYTHVPNCFEQQCNVAFSLALVKLGELEEYHRAATAAGDEITPANVLTEDMKLPPGSAVFQIIQNISEDGEEGKLDMRGVLIGSETYDPSNAAHRVLAVINNMADQIIAMALPGSSVQRERAVDIEQRILKNGNPMLDNLPRTPGMPPELGMGYAGTVDPEFRPEDDADYKPSGTGYKTSDDIL